MNDDRIKNKFLKIRTNNNDPFQSIYNNRLTGFSIKFLYEIYKLDGEKRKQKRQKIVTKIIKL